MVAIGKIIMITSTVFGKTIVVTSFRASVRCIQSPICRLLTNQGGGSLTPPRTILSSSLKSKNNGYTILDPVEPSDNSNTQYNGYYYNGKRDLQQALQTAERAAFQAGEIMKQTSGKIAVSKTKTNTADLVTESDLECQRVIKNIILEECPQDSFLGEEDVDPGSMASSSALKDALTRRDQEDETEKLLWIVDPIDGTTNFQAGLPMFCVSIGVISVPMDNNTKDEPQVIAGVIYNPVLNEMVSAVRGRGSYLNGKRIHPSKVTEEAAETEISLDQALVNVGFPVYSEGTLRVSSRAVTALATKVRGLRMIASASQVMSWVAQGKFNAYVSWDLNAWDIAAGMVIVEESGGFISNFKGKRASISTRDMIITSNEGTSNHSLSKIILQVLTENDCLEY